MNKSTTLLQSKIRIKDIAVRANVSVGTVDRVLHNRGEVAKETRELINTIIKELEYKPNIIASALAMKKPFSLAVLLPLTGEKNSYWQLYLRGIEEAVKEMNLIDISLAYYFFEINSEESLRIQHDQLIETKPDAVITVPLFGAIEHSISQSFTDNQIPFITLDVPFDNKGAFDSITQDAYQSGYIAAKLMSYGVSKETTVLIVNIGSEAHCHSHCAARIKGFKAYLTEHNITETKLRTVTIPSAAEEVVKKHMNEAFLDYSFVRGLFVCGSDVHRVAKFVDDKKLGNIRIVGFDLLESNVHYLKKGTVDFLITQKPESQGYKGTMKLINSIALKQPNKENTPIPIDIITKENVDYHLNRSV